MSASSTPVVSVALPVRNGERYLVEAIESVLSQEGVDLELRVYDNRSSDGSVEIAAGYLADPRVSVTVNEADLGAYGSLNRSLAESRGGYYVPFAADDVMLPGNLARKVALLEETGAGFAHSPAMIIDGGGADVGPSDPIDHLPELVEAPSFFRLAAPVNPVLTQAAVVRRDALVSIGGFDARVAYCADWLAWMRLSLRHSVVTVHEPLIRYRLHAGSGTADGLSNGWHARDVPAAADAIFDDEAMPAEWRAMRPAIAGARLALSAQDLADARLWRSDRGNGYAAYVLAGWALAELPRDAAARDYYLELVRAAGLAQPELPLDAVTIVDAPGAAALVAEASSLRRAGLLSRLAVGAAPEAVEGVVDALERELAAAPELDIDLVPVDSLTRLVRPGRVVLAPFGSPHHLEAERLGAPCFPTQRPTPFAERRDPARWQVVVPEEIAA